MSKYIVISFLIGVRGRVQAVVLPSPGQRAGIREPHSWFCGELPPPRNLYTILTGPEHYGKSGQDVLGCAIEGLIINGPRQQTDQLYPAG
jgi:hypothetical protein